MYAVTLCGLGSAAKMLAALSDTYNQKIILFQLLIMK